MSPSGSRIVDTDRGKEVILTYSRACKDYVIGFSTALFMLAGVMGYLIMWKQHVPESVYHLSVLFFVISTFVGFGLVAIAYTAPVWFYETLEGSPDE